MQKRRIFVIGSTAVCLLLGGAGALAAAHPSSGPIPQSPAATDAPDVPGQPDLPEPGDTPDVSDAPDVQGVPDLPEPGDTPDAPIPAPPG